MRQDLYDQVISRLKQEKKKRHTRRVLFSVVSLCTSCAGTVFFFIQLWTHLVSSGFFSYLEIAGSDVSIVVRYWEDFAFLLGESLPVLEVIAFLTASFILLGSVRYVLKYTYDKRLI